MLIMLWVTFALISLVIFLTFSFLNKQNDYWNKRGVPSEKPILLLGNLKEVFLGKTSVSQHMAEIYFKYHREPYVGYYNLWKPCLIIKNPIIIQEILIKNFSNFPDRPIASDKNVDPMAYYFVPGLKYPLWKKIRSKVSPAFSLAKLKLMLPLMKKCGDDFFTYLEKKNGQIVDVKEISGRYTTNVIASCAFGLEANSFKEDNSEFLMAAKLMFDFSFVRSFSMLAYFLMPSLVSLLKLKFVEPRSVKFLKKVFWQSLLEREKSGTRRNDFLDILIDIKNLDKSLEVDDDILPAQAITFFGAGHETSSSTIALTIYEMCINVQIQNKLRSEIRELLKKHKEISYESIQGMKYLDMVLSEVLRKYPFAPFVTRETMSDFKVPGHDLTIEKNVNVFIPLRGLHYDSEYYPDPENFNPERFSQENRSKLSNCIYMPFGAGPRNCLGDRFAILIVKIALVYFFRNFKAVKCNKTEIPLTFNSRSPLLTCKNGIFVKIKKSELK